MRTAVHIVLILLAGIGLGLFVRSLRTAINHEQPTSDDIVYTTDVAPGAVIDDAAMHFATGNADETEFTAPTDDLPDGWTTQFKLTERSGESFTSDQLLGTPYLVSFFFSQCPSTCVQQNQKLQQLQKEFQGENVRFLAISVDPEHDSPEVLKEYAARFGADPDQWLFLTGDLNHIRRVGAEMYFLPVDKQLHTERFILMDEHGKPAGKYLWSDERQFTKLKTKIQEMLSHLQTEKS
jgi:protein SCO1